MTRPRHCDATKSGRCNQPGKPRAMLHVCSRFPNHDVDWHRCECSHVWRDQNTTDNHEHDGARRREGMKR